MENFRGARKGALDDLSRINVLVGPNGACKSTVLEAIWLAKAFGSESLDHVFGTPLIRRTGRGWRVKDLFTGYNTTNPIVLSFSLDDGSKAVFRLSKSGYPRPDSTFEVDLRVWAKGQESMHRTWNYGDTWRSGGGSGSPEQYSFLGNTQLIDHLRSGEDTQVESVFLTPRQVAGEEAVLTSHLQDVYPQQVADYTFMQWGEIKEGRSAFKARNLRVFFDHLSDGERAGIRILATCLGSRETIVLIEEPENGQHPAALRRLIAKVVEIANDNDLQVFMTTHRPEVVRGVVQSAGRHSRIYHVRSGTNQELQVQSPDWNSIELLRSIGWDSADMIRGLSRFAVVEGALDLALVEAALARLFPEPEIRELLTVMNGRGKDKNSLLQFVRGLVLGGHDVVALPDLDDATAAAAQKVVFTAVAGLRQENPAVQVRGDEIYMRRGEGQETKIWRIDSAIPLGLPTEFAHFEKHCGDDYVLKLLLDPQNESIAKAECCFDLAEKTRTARSAKGVLRACLTDGYHPDAVKHLVETAKALPRELEELVAKIARVSKGEGK